MTKDDVLTVDKALRVNAADQIVLERGRAKKMDGPILLDGKDITPTGSGRITVNASGEVMLTGGQRQAELTAEGGRAARTNTGTRRVNET